MTVEELQAENDQLKAELANARLQADLASLSTTPQTIMPSLNAPPERTRIVESVVNVGMTKPRDSKTIVVAHPNDPKTGEKISATVRTDQGYDPHQQYFGRQP